MMKPRRTAEQRLANKQQFAHEAEQRALHPLTSRQTIADSQAAPEFQANLKRLEAERLGEGGGAEDEGEVSRSWSRGIPSNDDKSPLIDLLNCIVCKETMKIEKSTPDAEGGGDMVQYRCGRCGRIERVRLFRRSGHEVR